jgi:hypothetical protein
VTVQRFDARVEPRSGPGLTLSLDFDPTAVWGTRDVYRVNGTIAGAPFRGTVERRGGTWTITLGQRSPSFVRAAGQEEVPVALELEGPQSQNLAADVAAALADRPRAQKAFDELATFYRKGWLRWIDATTRRPDVRTARIAEMIQLLEAGRKER